jgi:hypothetical protein
VRQLLAYLGSWTDQVEPLDQRRRHRGRGILATSLQVEALDLDGGVLEAHSRDHVEMEVLLARAHASHVEGQPRAQLVAGTLDVVVNDHRHHRRHLERRGVAP